MAYDYESIINDELGPTLIDTVFYKTMDELFGIFGKAPNKNGTAIYHEFRTANSSNNAAYTKNSVDVAAGTQTIKA